MIFATKRFIHFNQCDPAGILFFGESFIIAHQIIEEFIEAVGIGWNTWFEHDELVFPIRHSNCDYIRPLKTGEHVEFHLSIDTLSLSTVCFSLEAKSSKGLHFRVKTVHTRTEKKSFSKTEFPLNIKEKSTYFNDNDGPLYSNLASIA